MCLFDHIVGLAVTLAFDLDLWPFDLKI